MLQPETFLSVLPQRRHVAKTQSRVRKAEPEFLAPWRLGALALHSSTGRTGSPQPRGLLLLAVQVGAAPCSAVLFGRCQFAQVREDPLSRAAGRAIRFDLCPVGARLAVLASFTSPEKHASTPSLEALAASHRILGFQDTRSSLHAKLPSARPPPDDLRATEGQRKCKYQRSSVTWVS